MKTLLGFQIPKFKLEYFCFVFYPSPLLGTLSHFFRFLIMMAPLIEFDTWDGGELTIFLTPKRNQHLY